MNTKLACLLASSALILGGAGSALADKPGMESSPTTSTVTVQAADSTPSNTGVTLTGSKRVTVTASGTWTAGPVYGTYGPDGSHEFEYAACTLDPAAPLGALVSSLDGTTWTLVGTGPTVISGVGTLLLAINECQVPGAYSDNSGSVSATITPVVPDTAAQCKNGGWQTYSTFKNQGDCVSYVANGK